MDNKGRSVHNLFTALVYSLGNEYISIVEFAPNQKIPSQKEQKRRDPKINTIEQDPDYVKFLEMLENKPEVIIIRPLL